MAYNYDDLIGAKPAHRRAFEGYINENRPFFHADSNAAQQLDQIRAKYADLDNWARIYGGGKPKARHEREQWLRQQFDAINQQAETYRAQNPPEPAVPPGGQQAPASPAAPTPPTAEQIAEAARIAAEQAATAERTGRKAAMDRWWKENGPWRSTGTQGLPPGTGDSYSPTDGFGPPALPAPPAPGAIAPQPAGGVPGSPAANTLTMPPPAAQAAPNALAALVGTGTEGAPASAWAAPTAPAGQAAQGMPPNPYTQQPDAGAWTAPSQGARSQTAAQPWTGAAAPWTGATPARARNRTGAWGPQATGTWGL